MKTGRKKKNKFIELINEKQIQPYKEKTKTIISRAQSLSIISVKDMPLAADALKEIKSLAEKIKEIKEKITKPANDIIKATRMIFGPMESMYREAEQIIKGKMLAFNEKQEKQALLKSEKIISKVEKGEMDISEASAIVEKLKPQNEFSGENGIVQYRKKQIIVITDIQKIPRQYLVPDEVLIRKDMIRGVKIPGCELKETKIVTSYGK